MRIIGHGCEICVLAGKLFILPLIPLIPLLFSVQICVICVL